MVRRHFFIASVVVAVAAAGCEHAKSANPNSPSVAGAIPGVAITAPLLVDPSMHA